MKKLTICFVIVISIALLSFSGYTLVVNIKYPTKYKQEILHYCGQFILEPQLIASLINVESHYDSNAKSSKNALGLMQIKLDTANYMASYYDLNMTLTESDLLQVDTNLYFGCLYLSYLSQKFEDKYTMLSAYNAGETIVASWLNNSKYSSDKITLKNIPYKETENYINKIKINYNYYSKHYLK